MSEQIKIRFSKKQDAPYLLQWFQEPGVLRWFPLSDKREIEDAVRVSLNYAEGKAALTATLEDIPVGFANLYINTYEKLAHQCLFFILVDAQHRNKGIGSKLIREMEVLAKEQFHIELLHLEVYEGNPAIALYERLGYVRYGFQPKFLKEEGGIYRGKIFMQKFL